MRKYSAVLLAGLLLSGTLQAQESENTDSDLDGVSDSMDNCPSTAMNLAVDADGCPAFEIVEYQFDLLVTFDSFETAIKPEFNDTIKAFAEFMRNYPDSTALIEGHTDTDGTESENEDLSVNRANAVISLLVEEYEIAPTRLSATGHGESLPVAANNTEEGRALNRRVESLLSVQDKLLLPR